MPAPISVIVGGVSITEQLEDLQFSNSDPGGHEALQCSPYSVRGLFPGARAQVLSGHDVIWDGRVNEVGQSDASGKDAITLAAVGAGAVLRDRAERQIFVDRDLSRWGPPNDARVRALGTGFLLTGSSTVVPDDTRGFPILRLQFTEIKNPNPPLELAEVWYSAAGIPLGELFFDRRSYDRSAGGYDNFGAGWIFQGALSTDEAQGVTDVTGNIAAASPSVNSLFASASNRQYAALTFYFNSVLAETQGDWRQEVRSLAVFGLHQMPVRGRVSSSVGASPVSNPGGFWASDIARYVLRRSGTGFASMITDAVNYIIPHLLYLDPTTYEQMLNDMAAISGWHWGVWEPGSLTDTRPTLWFTPPPTEATCSIARADCLQLDVPKVRLDLLYDTANVQYIDAGGNVGIATVTLANDLLAQAGITGRALNINMGTGSYAAAQVLGMQALRLSQRTARGGGSAILPLYVRTSGGALIEACKLKAGRDRIRITDLPDGGSLTDTDTRRFDTFHISRVEVTVDADGIPQTRVEFDGGADLLEVIQSRLDTAVLVAGG